MNTILITGICGGMGAAAAKLLIHDGYAVYGIDKKDTCDINGVVYAKADITDPEELDGAAAKFNGVRFDAIAHFAGIYDMNSLIEISERDFEKICRINFFGAFFVNKKFFKQLKEKGKIIITSSELAPLDPLPFTGLYAMTKTALEKYADALRMEVNSLGVSVSVIRPGAVNTNLINDSTAALDRLCDNTELYSCNAKNFRAIVNSVETKSVSPEKIAKTLEKALKAKKPRYVYNLNRNFWLRLLSAMPKRFQVWIITKIISKKSQNS